MCLTDDGVLDDGAASTPSADVGAGAGAGAGVGAAARVGAGAGAAARVGSAKARPAPASDFVDLVGHVHAFGEKNEAGNTLYEIHLMM